MKHVPPEQSILRARAMRRDATDAERRLWYLLRQYWPAMRFRRQVPIAHYIADFASHRLKLVIELDGGQHGVESGVERDVARSAVIEAHGYRIVRFWNNALVDNEEGVLLQIAEAIAGASPSPNGA